MNASNSIKRVANNDMTDLNQYLIEAARRINEAIKEARKKYTERFNVGFYVGDILSFMVNPADSFKGNLDNILAIAEGNTIVGIFLECSTASSLDKAVSKDNRINELENLCYRMKAEKTEEARLKMMAFLFIVRNGLEDAFCAFNANYNGNVEEDIQREFERIYGKGHRFN